MAGCFGANLSVNLHDLILRRSSVVQRKFDSPEMGSLVREGSHLEAIPVQRDHKS
jgi:hypothetical protein